MPLEKLPLLKKKLLSCPNFSEICAYFFDHFGEDAAFLAASRPVQHEHLPQILAAAASQILQRAAQVNHLLLLEVPGHPLVHGTGTISGRLFSVFYFTNIDTGMFSLMTEPATSQMSHVRISGQRFRPGGETDGVSVAE